jgi:serine/threonine-protein phosphatase 2A regulatory subunit B''
LIYYKNKKNYILLSFKNIFINFIIIYLFISSKNIDEDFKEMHIICALKKFFFFFYPKKTGRIYIKDILTSQILPELYELRQK